MPLPGDVPSAEQVTPKKKEPFFYGGQAVIEGVMMRGKRYYAVAVRLPTTKEIVIDRGELKAPIYTNPFWKLPLVRGVALIGEQLHLGMRSLMWSANVNAGSRDIEISKKEITGSVAVAMVFALALFIGLLLPVLGTQKFTTREPSDDMLEVAIAAFNSAREGEEQEAAA